VSEARAHLLVLIELAKGRARSPSIAEAEALFLTEIMQRARSAIAELPATIPPAPPDVEAQLEAAARSDADEILRPPRRRATPAERDTLPAPPPLGEGDGVLEPASGR
jgi:hypothetical protein